MPDTKAHEATGQERLRHERRDRAKANELKQHLDQLLDQALEETFPASDPPAIAVAQGKKQR